MTPCGAQKAYVLAAATDTAAANYPDTKAAAGTGQYQPTHGFPGHPGRPQRVSWAWLGRVGLWWAREAIASMYKSVCEVYVANIHLCMLGAWTI